MILGNAPIRLLPSNKSHRTTRVLLPKKHHEYHSSIKNHKILTPVLWQVPTPITIFEHGTILTLFCIFDEGAFRSVHGFRPCVGNVIHCSVRVATTVNLEDSVADSHRTSEDYLHQVNGHPLASAHRFAHKTPVRSSKTCRENPDHCSPNEERQI